MSHLWCPRPGGRRYRHGRERSLIPWGWWFHFWACWPHNAFHFLWLRIPGSWEARADLGWRLGNVPKRCHLSGRSQRRIFGLRKARMPDMSEGWNTFWDANLDETLESMIFLFFKINWFICYSVIGRALLDSLRKSWTGIGCSLCFRFSPWINSIGRAPTLWIRAR